MKKFFLISLLLAVSLFFVSHVFAQETSKPRGKKKRPPVVTGPVGEEIDKEEDGKKKRVIKKKPSKKALKKAPEDPPERTGQTQDDPAFSSDEDSPTVGFGDGKRGSRPPAGDEEDEEERDIKLKGKKILEN